MLCGQASYAHKNSIVYNPDENMNINFENVIPNQIPNEIKESSTIKHNVSENGKWCLANMISTKYLDSYSDWSRIVWSMKNEHYSKHQAELISKKSDKFEQTSFDNIWNAKCGTSKVTFGTLKYYAKNSNLAEYENLIMQESKLNKYQNLLHSCNGTHGEIAEILYMKHSKKFVC